MHQWMRYEMNEFYVYVHRRETDGLPFYVGKGHSKRAWVFSKRNKYWKNTKNKHGILVEIVFENLSEEEAFDCEKNTILEFKHFGYPLTNMTFGGEGVKGLIVSEETRNKISISSRNRVVLDETRLKLSIANSGKKLTEQHKKKLSLARLGKSPPNLNKKQISTSGVNNPSSDKNTYIFMHENGEIFKGNRYDLCNKYNLPIDKIGKLFYTTPRQKVRGWKLVKDIKYE